MLPRSLTLSRTPSLPPGADVSRSRMTDARARVARTPPPSFVARQWRHPHPPVEGRCQPPELSPAAPPPLSSPFSPPRGAKPRTPSAPSLCAAPSGRHKRRRPPPFPFFASSPSSTPECRALSSTTPCLDASCPPTVTERLLTPLDSSLHCRHRPPSMESWATSPFPLSIWVVSHPCRLPRCCRIPT
jgi:hypothetical protein